MLYMYIHIYMFIHRILKHTCKGVQTTYPYICIYIFMYIYTHTHTYINRAPRHTCKGVQMTYPYICICMQTHTHAYTHTHTHTHTYIHSALRLQQAYREWKESQMQVVKGVRMTFQIPLNADPDQLKAR